jgi:hypothetical protein
MSYNGSGTFQINTSGQPVVTGTVISSSAFNALTADLATGLSTAITKDGQTATTVRIPFAQGINSSLATDATNTTTGSIYTAGGVGIAKALWVGGLANIAGALAVGGAATFSATPIFSALTASSAVATDASKNLVSVTNTGTGSNVLATSPTLVTPALGTPASGVMTNVTGINYDGFKNRIINGAMVIDQRNAGASVSSGFPVDRWSIGASQASKFTAQRNAGSVTPPAGFINYLGMTSSSAYSVTSTDYFFVSQVPEGFNAADFAFGSASATSVTLSFRAYSSLTGTFGGCIKNGNANRSYPFSYTISSANTWTTISITIPGDTSGTWATDNSAWGYVLFCLGSGSTRLGTVNTWAAANYDGPTGATSVVGTNGATFYITGVQLEKGSTATSFDYRSIGTELFLCQRYFEKSYNIGTVAGTATEAGMAQSSQNAATSGTGFIGANISWKVSKRGAPTTTLYDVAGTINTTTRYTLGGTTGAGQNGTVQDSNENFLSVYSSGTTNTAGIKFHYVTTAEL